jgi:hypothetical protein
MNSIIHPAGFDSWHSYSSFCFAREFADRQTGDVVERRMTRLEKIGHYLAAALSAPLDAVLREFRNPLVIVALTVSMLFIASIVFYPVQAMALACRILPFLRHVRPWHAKAALYALSQTVLLGLGLRSVGRLSDPNLMSAYLQKKIMPIPIGAVRIGSGK